MHKSSRFIFLCFMLDKKLHNSEESLLCLFFEICTNMHGSKLREVLIFLSVVGCGIIGKCWLNASYTTLGSALINCFIYSWKRCMLWIKSCWGEKKARSALVSRMQRNGRSNIQIFSSFLWQSYAGLTEIEHQKCRLSALLFCSSEWP